MGAPRVALTSLRRLLRPRAHACGLATDQARGDEAFQLLLGQLLLARGLYLESRGVG